MTIISKKGGQMTRFPLREGANDLGAKDRGGGGGQVTATRKVEHQVYALNYLCKTRGFSSVVHIF